MNRSHGALAAALVASLVLAACGDPSDTSPSFGGSASADTTATTPPDGGSGLLPPRPIAVSADPGTSRDPGSTAESAAVESAPADVAADTSMLVPWESLSFEFADGLVLPTDDTGYVFGASGEIDLDRIASLARAFGVEGEIAVVPTEGGGWRIGPSDGSAPSVQVGSGGQLDWWYSPAWAIADDEVVVDDCAVPFEDDVLPTDGAAIDAEAVLETPAEDVPAATISEEPVGSAEPGTVVIEPVDDVSIPVCEPVEVAPPTGVPGADEARRLADDLLAAAGIDTGGLEVEVMVDDWSASVTYSVADPTRPPSYVGIGFGGEAELQWASGTLGEPSAAGPYPLVDLAAATERVERFYAFDASDLPVGDVDIALVDPAEGAPVDGQEPIERVVTITLVRASLWGAWEEGGSVTYVPAYEFVGDDDSTWIVPAVTDDFLIVEEPAVDEPAVDEPVVEEPVLEEPVITEEVPPMDEPTVEPEPEASVPATEPVVDPEMPAEVTEGDAQVLVGLTEAEAEDTAAAAGWGFRVVERDGEPLAMTMDLRPNRINVAVVDGVVTAVMFIG